MNGNVLANLATVIDGDIRMDDGTVANLHIFTYTGKRTDVDVFADNSRLCDKGKGMNTHLLRQRGGIHLEQLGYTFIGILHPDERCADRLFKFHVLVNQNDGGLCFVDILGIFGIGKKSDGSLFAFFYLSKSVNNSIVIAFHTTANKVGYLFGCKLHHITFSFNKRCKDTKKYSNSLITQVIFTYFF